MRRSVFVVVASVSLIAGGAVEVSGAAAAKPAWSIASFASPAGATSVDFEGVACRGANSCFAVGHSSVGNHSKTLAERWNGSKWSVTASPNPAGSADSFLQGVSCASATNCVAVGYSAQGSTVQSLAEQWNGTTWSVVTTPVTPAWTDPALDSVSCASTTSCLAVGDGRAITGESLVEHWDGSAWSVLPVAKLDGWTEISFDGVSCPSATSCFAVGFYQSVAFGPLRTLVEHWDGSGFSIQASPSPAGALPANLAHVACPSVASCFAVGSYSPPKGGGFKTLVDRWNGTTWSAMTSPNAQSTKTFASDVSCASVTSCFAVGQYFHGAIGRTFVERWTGSAWSIIASANPVGSTDSRLKGVSCPTPIRCFAVGTATIKKVTKGLIERYQ